MRRTENLPRPNESADASVSFRPSRLERRSRPRILLTSSGFRGGTEPAPPHTRHRPRTVSRGKSRATWIGIDAKPQAQAGGYTPLSETCQRPTNIKIVAVRFLACPVRGCGHPFEREPSSLRCTAGHSFDRAREGYWNLLQPQDRKSSVAGDAEGSVEARRRWLERGFAEGLIAALRGLLAGLAVPAEAVVVDAGCGEGTITAAVAPAPGREICGVDLSVKAIRFAARRWPESTWIVANADRRLPIADGSVDLVLSIFGRRNRGEFARILKPRGSVVVAVPGPDDLAELREAAQGRSDLRDRVPGTVAEMAPAFAIAARIPWRDRRVHDRAAIEDALAMTYRGARRSESRRRAGIETIDLTLSAELLVFARSTSA